MKQINRANKLKKFLNRLQKFLDIAFLSFILLFLFLVIVNKNDLVNAIGYEFNIVQSSSMRGEINKYDFLVISKINPKNINVGDIVVFYDDTGTHKIIHRVISITIQSNDERLFKTKGDNNSAPDFGYRTENQIYAKYSFKIPYLGLLITFLLSKYGILVVVINTWNILLINLLFKYNSVLGVNNKTN